MPIGPQPRARTPSALGAVSTMVGPKPLHLQDGERAVGRPVGQETVAAVDAGETVPGG